MSDIDIDAARALCDVPLTYCGGRPDDACSWSDVCGIHCAVAVRDLVPALLDEVERLSALVNAKRSWIDGARVDIEGLQNDRLRFMRERDEARAALAEVVAMCHARLGQYPGAVFVEDVLNVAERALRGDRP